MKNIIFLTKYYYYFLFFLDTLKHVAKTVAHVDLDDHMINVIFTIFDENRKLIFFTPNVAQKSVIINFSY